MRIQPPPGKPLKITRSKELKARAEKIIPSCSQTFSKSPTQFVQGVAPIFIERGEGCHVWDVDGNEYIDYPMALGPIVLGYNYRPVTEAVVRQMKLGMTFSLPHPLEVHLAERLVQIVPCAEMVRFAKNGSDATSGAIRVARASTGRDRVACCGYHGWQDWYIGTTSRNKGVPKAVSNLTHPFEYNKIQTLERIFAKYPGEVAAVIMEPIGVIEPEPDFLEKVRTLTHQEGALLIFDEIITGFRLSLGGAQQHFKITPDLACFGKAIANGFPLSAVVGKRDIMKLFDEIFFSFTFGGETLSLAAALATLAEMQARPVIDHLWTQGEKLKKGYNQLAQEFGLTPYTSCVGLAPRTVVGFRDAEGNESLLLKSLFQQECLKQGVLFTGSQNVSFSHTDQDIEQTLNVYERGLKTLAQSIELADTAKRLEGLPVEPVFRKA